MSFVRPGRPEEAGDAEQRGSSRGQMSAWVGLVGRGPRVEEAWGSCL